jgi:LysM repeat protein
MRLSSISWSAGLVLGGVMVHASTGHAEQPPDDYVVKAGDTCMDIAVRALGDRRLLPELHRLNPQLGKLPHVLKPGQVIKVPHVEPTPDARLTGKSGDVRVQPPSTPDWNSAKRGMDLFRAWRVDAQARASAEVTFTDTQQLFLRENTIVVIYGPERRRARIDAPEAVLERGTLRSRLDELSGKPIKVTTPSAEANLGRGSAVVSVDDAGLSTVANHDGAAIDLRGRSGGKVAVKSGMGTRVATGKKPEKPRPLPPPPIWASPGPIGFVALAGGATVSAAWDPEPKAATYRFELLRGNAVVAAGEVPATATRFELNGAPPGDYTARLASFDKDRLESKPGTPLVVHVRSVALVAPGEAAPPIAAATGDDEPIAAGVAPSLVVAARGTRVVADGVTCAVASAAPASVLVLDQLGDNRVQCSASDGLGFAPFAIDVTTIAVAAATATTTVIAGQAIDVDLAIESSARLGDSWQLEASPGLVVDSQAHTDHGIHATISARPDAPAIGTVRVLDATTQRVIGEIAITVTPVTVAVIDPPVVRQPTGRQPAQFTLGGFAGVAVLPTGADEGNELGNAALPADIPGSGAAIGLRAAWWFNRDLFVEAEAVAIPTQFAGGDQSAWVLGGHGHVGVRMIDYQRYELRALLGGGGFALRSDSTFAQDDIDPNIDWGVTASVDLGGPVRLRVDGRQHIVPDRIGGVTDTFELNAGVEFVARRQH